MGNNQKIFNMTREQATQIISDNESLVVGCTYNVLFTNDIVIGKTYEAIVAIKESPLYRMTMKKAIKKVDSERLIYERLSNGVIGERSDFFARANDKFVEEVQDYIDILYFSIKQELDNKCIIHSSEISKLELARMLCEFGCVQLDSREEALVKKDPRFRKMNINYLRQTKLNNALSDAVKALNIPDLKCKTGVCLKAINNLAVKLAEADTIAKAISV
jgi:hypothetical protein